MENYKTIHQVDFVLSVNTKFTIHQLTDIRNLNDVEILHYEEEVIKQWNVSGLVKLNMVIALDDYGSGTNDASLFLDTIFNNSCIEVISYDEQQLEICDECKEQ